MKYDTGLALETINITYSTDGTDIYPCRVEKSDYPGEGYNACRYFIISIVWANKSRSWSSSMYGRNKKHA
jgi:hypothetical protein